MAASQTVNEMAGLVEKGLGIHVSHIRPCVTERGGTVSCLVSDFYIE